MGPDKHATFKQNSSKFIAEGEGTSAGAKQISSQRSSFCQQEFVHGLRPMMSRIGASTKKLSTNTIESTSAQQRDNNIVCQEVKQKGIKASVGFLPNRVEMQTSNLKLQFDCRPGLKASHKSPSRREAKQPGVREVTVRTISRLAQSKRAESPSQIYAKGVGALPAIKNTQGEQDQLMPSEEALKIISKIQAMQINSNNIFNEIENNLAREEQNYRFLRRQVQGKKAARSQRFESYI